MMVLMPMICWKMARPAATTIAGLTHGAASSPRPPSSSRSTSLISVTSRATDPSPRGTRSAPRAALALLGLRALARDGLLVAGLAQDVAGLVLPAPAHQPPRGLRHEVHPDEEHEGGNNGEPQHRAPGFGGGEQRVDY